MKSELLFEFEVDRPNTTILINREFDAPLKLVWEAWTTAEKLDQWWGPHPWRVETKSMDFRENGRWLYAMIGPKGQKHWSLLDYLKIVDEKSITARDGFCDEHGTINPQMSQSIWTNHFISQGERTLVRSKIEFDTLDDLEQIVRMGFQEGMTQCLDQLSDLLM